MKAIFRRNSYWGLCIVAIVLVSAYWVFWATDRYVSRTVVVLESPQIASPEVSFASILGGGGSSDLLLLREHLLSVDMLRRAQEQLDLREHYSSHGDFFSRLRDPDAPIEDLHRYYQRRVKIDMDEYAKVLKIEVQANTPQFAHDLAALLLEAGEQHMNEMGQHLAEEQVRFLEQQLGRLEGRLDKARADLLDYQNEHGLISPIKTVENLNQVVATLEGELARLEARRSALASFHSAQSAEMVRIESEVEALREQIGKERGRLAQVAGDSLNRVSSEYQTLEQRAKFAQETYSSAMAALENTRIEAARTLKQVSVLQSPVLPEYATEPRRLYNATVFGIVALFVTFILNMLILIVRDHRD
ncbi:chain-length determining protein [Halomonas stenophila]|uniref:Capsular polysaccharide transport system permease protein n=1 Tax=Halomonas stenophila TaxID=795312 RepID=A0A7W5HIS2_9GAMM|nr:chain-length determining protein [Halomonas stenophila]MBB3230155.1 capsular polysaccharide transport system permease protein [Halomonas stenophila]